MLINKHTSTLNNVVVVTSTHRRAVISCSTNEERIKSGTKSDHKGSTATQKRSANTKSPKQQSSQRIAIPASTQSLASSTSFPQSRDVEQSSRKTNSPKPNAAAAAGEPHAPDALITKLQLSPKPSSTAEGMLVVTDTMSGFGKLNLKTQRASSSKTLTSTPTMKTSQPTSSARIRASSSSVTSSPPVEAVRAATYRTPPSSPLPSPTHRTPTTLSPPTTPKAPLILPSSPTSAATTNNPKARDQPHAPGSPTTSSTHFKTTASAITKNAAPEITAPTTRSRSSSPSSSPLSLPQSSAPLPTRSQPSTQMEGTDAWGVTLSTAPGKSPQMPARGKKAFQGMAQRADPQHGSYSSPPTSFPLTTSSPQSQPSSHDSSSSRLSISTAISPAQTQQPATIPTSLLSHSGSINWSRVTYEHSKNKEELLDLMFLAASDPTPERLKQMNDMQEQLLLSPQAALLAVRTMLLMYKAFLPPDIDPKQLAIRIQEQPLRLWRRVDGLQPPSAHRASNKAVNTVALVDLCRQHMIADLLSLHASLLMEKRGTSSGDGMWSFTAGGVDEVEMFQEMHGMMRKQAHQELPDSRFAVTAAACEILSDNSAAAQQPALQLLPLRLSLPPEVQDIIRKRLELCFLSSSYREASPVCRAIVDIAYCILDNTFVEEQRDKKHVKAWKGWRAGGKYVFICQSMEQAQTLSESLTRTYKEAGYWSEGLNAKVSDIRQGFEVGPVVVRWFPSKDKSCKWNLDVRLHKTALSELMDEIREAFKWARGKASDAAIRRLNPRIQYWALRLNDYRCNYEQYSDLDYYLHQKQLKYGKRTQNKKGMWYVVDKYFQRGAEHYPNESYVFVDKDAGSSMLKFKFFTSVNSPYVLAHRKGTEGGVRGEGGKPVVVATRGVRVPSMSRKRSVYDFRDE